MQKDRAFLVLDKLYLGLVEDGLVANSHPVITFAVLAHEEFYVRALWHNVLNNFVKFEGLLASLVPLDYGVNVIYICSWDLIVIKRPDPLIALEHKTRFVSVVNTISASTEMIAMLIIFVPGEVFLVVPAPVPHVNNHLAELRVGDPNKDNAVV